MNMIEYEYMSCCYDLVKVCESKKIAVTSTFRNSAFNCTGGRESACIPEPGSRTQEENCRLIRNTGFNAKFVLPIETIG